MTLTLEQSFKKRLQLLAKERNLPPAVVWQNVITDRFLVRLCKSPYKANFILKGGILLAKHLNIGRETIDLDFSVDNFSPDIQKICQALEEIIAIEIDDGFIFKNVKAETVNHFHTNYPGAQIRIDANFGKSQYSLFIDLGFKDHVEIKDENILLLANSKGPLFENEINIKCFPLEFVFAEKLETIVYRGADNSRMKDFHDLYTMANSGLLQPQELKNAIQVVFTHRNTPLNLPIQFDEALQSYWKRYLQTVNDLPTEIQTIINVINVLYSHLDITS